MKQNKPLRYKKGSTSKLVHAYQTYHVALDGFLSPADRKALAQRGFKPPSQKQFKLKILLATCLEYATNELNDAIKMLEIQNKKKETRQKRLAKYANNPELMEQDPILVLDERDTNIYALRHAAILEFVEALRIIEELFYPARN